MFSSHRNLDRKEINPIKGSVVTSLKTGNRFRIVGMDFNTKFEVIKYYFQTASSKDGQIHELDLDIFWETFTTR
jgi:hypothetical protein